MYNLILCPCANIMEIIQPCQHCWFINGTGLSPRVYHVNSPSPLYVYLPAPSEILVHQRSGYMYKHLSRAAGLLSNSLCNFATDLRTLLHETIKIVFIKLQLFDWLVHIYIGLKIYQGKRLMQLIYSARGPPTL